MNLGFMNVHVTRSLILSFSVAKIALPRPITNLKSWN